MKRVLYLLEGLVLILALGALLIALVSIIRQQAEITTASLPSTPTGTPTLFQCVPTPQPYQEVGTRTPTPRFGEITTPVFSPSVTPIPYSKINDLSPRTADRDKANYAVYRCDGTFELFLVGSDLTSKTLTETLGLRPGDIILFGAPPASMMGHHPPTPPVLPTLSIEHITLEQARQTAGFHLLEPAYLSQGFLFERVTHWSDIFDLEYHGRSTNGTKSGNSFVMIRERWAPPTPLPPGFFVPSTPDVPSETVRIHGIRALVVRSFPPPAWFTPEPSNELYPSLEWYEQNILLTVGGSVSLDELVKIAESLK